MKEKIQRTIKKSLMVATIFLASGIWCNAEPFLVCDPYPVKPIGFIYVLDNSTEVKVAYSEITTDDGERVAVVCDMAGAPEGDHKIIVRAYNEWGQSDPVPFDFNRSAPGGPGNIRFRR